MDFITVVCVCTGKGGELIIVVLVGKGACFIIVVVVVWTGKGVGLFIMVVVWVWTGKGFCFTIVVWVGKVISEKSNPELVNSWFVVW